MLLSMRDTISTSSVHETMPLMEMYTPSSTKQKCTLWRRGRNACRLLALVHRYSQPPLKILLLLPHIHCCHTDRCLAYCFFRFAKGRGGCNRKNVRLQQKKKETCLASMLACRR